CLGFTQVLVQLVGFGSQIQIRRKLQVSTVAGAGVRTTSSNRNYGCLGTEISLENLAEATTGCFEVRAAEAAFDFRPLVMGNIVAPFVRGPGIRFIGMGLFT